MKWFKGTKLNWYHKGGEGREVKEGLRGRKEGEVKMEDFRESQS